MSSVALNQAIRDRNTATGDPKPLKRFRSTLSSMGPDPDLFSRSDLPNAQLQSAGALTEMHILVEDSSVVSPLGNPRSTNLLDRVAGLCAKGVVSAYYRNFMILVIVFNSVWLGVEADRNSDYTSSGSIDGGLIYAVECVLTTIFAIEIGVRMIAKYPNISEFFYANGCVNWIHAFDLGITILTIVDDWILEVVLPSRDNEEINFFIIVRAARLLRLVRLFILVDSLSFLARALGVALRSVTATFIILFTAIYIWAVVFTEWSQDAGIEATDEYFKEHYSTLFLSMLSMFELAVYDDAMYQVRTVLSQSALMGILLLIFIVVGGFLILNVLIGVIAEVVSELSDIEQARHLVSQMDEIFSLIDNDKDDRMSKAEFLKHGRPLLLKIGISDYVIEGVANIVDLSSNITSTDLVSKQDLEATSGHYISREEFIHYMTKMLSTPSSEDLLLINKKIANLKLKYLNTCPN